jgi:hypothetical protein
MSRYRRAAALLPLLAVLCAAAPATASTPIVSPLPGTPTAMPQTQISFLGASAGSLHSIAVVGSRSGRHSGRLRSYASAAGASFVPTHPFAPGETVTVSARWSSATGSATLRTNFKVAVPVPTLTQAFPVAHGTAADLQRFNSEPKLHPPVVKILQPASPGSAPGYIFAGPFQGPAQWGPMILDNAGKLVWFRRMPAGEDAADFRTQTYQGRTVLTWWQGHTVILGYGLGEEVVADSHYRTVAVVKAGNGMPTDEHEFTILPNGAAILIGYAPVRWNLSSAGGPAKGTALDTAVQEVDIRTGLVMWEWRSLGHVEVDQSYSKAPGFKGYFDYFHLNSAELLPDGSVLISARNTWGIYDIAMASGQLNWQVGGKSSTFTLGSGVRFAYQHNAMMLPNGELSLFDDEGAPTVTPPSRGELLKLDMQSHTATLAGQFVRTSGPLITGSQGNLQQLPNGNYMVGWGGLPNFTEFDAEGHQLFDGTFPAGEFNYRVYRFPWSGQPLTRPALLVRRGAAYVSWNGATTVAAWKLLAGSSPHALHPVMTVPSSGFETAIPAPSAAAYEVRAIGSSGQSLSTSPVVRTSRG